MGNKRQVVMAAAIAVLLPVLAWFAQSGEQTLDEKNRIARARPGEGSTFVELKLDAEGVLEDYDYELEVADMSLTESEADAAFATAKEEIDNTFYATGNTADCVTDGVNMRGRYAGGLVGAEWTLDSYTYMDVDGRLTGEVIPEKGVVVQAAAELTCERFRESYCFSFQLFPAERTPGEELLVHVAAALEEEQGKEGKAYLTLPSEVDGHALQWTQAEQNPVVQVLLFEAVILVLLCLVKQERKKQQEKLRKDEMMLDYAEVVSKLLILLGSGMSLKQAWNRISARYVDKREKNQKAKRYIYEEMAVTNYEILDGESERIAYQRFGERTGLGPYYRLIRILLQNLQTGSRGLCQMLEQESASALEERKALAKKLGEEAGTRMLLPLMMMLGIVMAIIMVPAILSFNT